MVPPPPPPPPEPLCNICNEPCNVKGSAFCVKCKKICVHFGCLGISSTANIKGMIFWSCAGCTPSFNAELSALDRITAVEKKLDCVDFLIREVTMLRNEIALIKKPEFPFSKSCKKWTQQESKWQLIQLSQCDSKQKKKGGWFWFWNCTEKSKIN